jgi:hypothetical protein
MAPATQHTATNILYEDIELHALAAGRKLVEYSDTELRAAADGVMLKPYEYSNDTLVVIHGTPFPHHVCNPHDIGEMCSILVICPDPETFVAFLPSWRRALWATRVI